MKNLLSTVILLVFGTQLLVNCSPDNQVIENKANTIDLIRADIANKKYYPNEQNKYAYSSVNFRNFLNQNSNLVNKSNSIGEARIGNEVTLSEYKAAVIDFYSNSGHSIEEIDSTFEATLSASTTYGYDYELMLQGLVDNGTIPQEEKEIIIEYVNYFFTTESFEEFSQIASVFTHYVNNSDFSEFEKRGMLTIFDTFKANKDLLEKSYLEFKFLQLLGDEQGDPSTAGKRKNHDIKCAGDVLVPMLAGAAVGNGLGFVAGFATGMWTAYSNGCMD